jgi:hypothetical protein
MHGKTLRDIERRLHIAVGILFMTLVFTPLGEGAPGMLLRFMLAPLLVTSGILMWQHARVVKLLSGSERRRVEAR